MDSAGVAAILLLGASLFVVLASMADARKSRRAVRARLLASWGELPSGASTPGDLQSIASYFLNRSKRSPSAFFIDDITWHDLDLDEIFQHLNSTATTPGEETLYLLLREPSFDGAELKSRQGLIAYFQNHTEERVATQLILSKLGKKRFLNPTDYFFSGAQIRLWRSRLYRSLSIVALMSPLLLFVHPGLGALVVVVSFVTNMMVYYRMRARIGSDLGALSYIVRLARCVRTLAETDGKALEPWAGDLRACRMKLRGIEKRGFYLLFAATGSLTDLAAEYIKIVLLKELIDYEYLLNAVRQLRDELLHAYHTVGLIDSMIAVASYRKGLAFYTEPDLFHAATGRGPSLMFEGIYHPLVNNPVLNSLAADRSVLVTGSNASGKSTFLKAVAVNAVFAQSIHTCLAKKYASCFFAVFSSMALKDRVQDGESYFVVEIKSIGRILSFLNDDIPCLCCIDEVLRGTNTVERIAASSQVLLHLAERRCICVAATHDIELTYILEPTYRNLHFQEKIADGGIEFEYRLHEGRATSRNAIKLLRLMGYDETIVAEAENRAARYLADGSWYPSPSVGEG